MFRWAGNYLYLLALTCLLAVHAIVLYPELAINRIDLNDNVLHFTMIQRMVEALGNGENPLDCWVSEWSLGYPVSRTYQPLGHIVPAVISLVLGKAVTQHSIFAWVRFLLVLMLPLTFYVTARLLGLPRPTALATALIAPLVSTEALYGIEYGSFLWRGSGLYTQAWAAHLLLLSIGLGYRAITSGNGVVWAGILTSLTLLAHLIYGWMAAWTIVLIALIPQSCEISRRFYRLGILGLTALALSAWFLGPMLLDSQFINHSRWEAEWKWNSFGAGRVLELLFKGDLLDARRFPVLSLLALVGFSYSVKAALTTTSQAMDRRLYRFLVWGSVGWLALFFGRSSWGVLYPLLGAGSDVHLHRLIGGIHIFSILLAGVGLALIWRQATGKNSLPRYVFVGVLTSLLLVPALRERYDYLQEGFEWGRRNLAAYEAEANDLEHVFRVLGDRPSRVYPGLAAGSGSKFRVGDVPIYAFLSVERVPAVAFLYHSMALTSDLMVRFDETNLAHYRLFNVGTVFTEKGREPPVSFPEILNHGRFRLLEAPGGGYLDVVSVPFQVEFSKDGFYDVNDRWLSGDWVQRRQHILLSSPAGDHPELPRLAQGDALPVLTEPRVRAGMVLSERRDGELYEAKIEIEEACYLLFKMTYHPNWKAFVDGVPRETSMLSPGFVGVRMEPGIHSVTFFYDAGRWKTRLLFLGVVVVVGLLLMERAGYWKRLEDIAVSAASALPDVRKRQSLAVIAILALIVPNCLPLLTSRQPGGHDSLSYPPRLIEFHENIRTGVLLPQWAPNLSSGYGQPFFVFNPPLFYYIAEIWQLLGFHHVTASNLACVLAVLASGWFMFLLCRHWFGTRGGLLGAAAYLYVPYFHVDLYVRAAYAEFFAFPFYPLALYGFLRFFETRDVRFLIVGSASYGAIILSHLPAALMFSPLLLAFVLLCAFGSRSFLAALWGLGGMMLGLALSAYVWIPSLTEMESVRVDTLLEGYFYYGDHFVYPQQLFHPSWDYGLSLPGYEDGMSFSLGWTHLLLAAAVFLFSLRKTRIGGTAAVPLTAGRALPFFGWTLLLGSLIMMPGALWFWDHLPLLKYVEFPWRLLATASFCLCIIVAGLSQFVPGFSRLILATAILVLPNLSHIRPPSYHSVDVKDFTPERIRTQGISVTSRREYQPRWLSISGSPNPSSARLLSGSAEVETFWHSPILRRVTVNAASESVVEIGIS